MAGEELKKDKNYAARERIAAYPDRAEANLSSISGKYDLDGYSDKEVIMAYKGGSFDASDYARLTGKSNDNGGEKDSSKSPGNSNSGSGNSNVESGSDPLAGMPTIGAPANSTNGQQQIVNQDNDINTSINGNNNTVNSNQDNSVGQYGGSDSYLSDWMKKYSFSKRLD